MENTKICRSPTAYFPLISPGRLGHRARTRGEGAWGSAEQRPCRNETRNYPTSEAPKTNTVLEVRFLFLSGEMEN